MAGAVTAAVNVPTSPSAASASAAFASLDAAPHLPASVAQPAADVRGTAALTADRFSLQTRQLAFEQAAEATAAKKAAKKAAAKKAAARKAAERKAAIAKKVAARKTAQQRAEVGGSPQAVAQSMLGQFGWSAAQYGCLVPLWGKESGWNTSASNPSSGAYGIPQALPGSKMASAGPDWQSSAATQIKWGLEYIQSTYGSPCGAWAHEETAGWY